MPKIKKQHLGCIAYAAFLLFPLIVNAESEVRPSSSSYDEELMLFKDIPSVYGASKYEQKVTEAPSSVSIVTASEIKKYGYRTLADILRSVRSFYVTNDRNYSYVGVRGFGRPEDYNSRILLLIDGHRANDNIYDSAQIGTEAIIDVDLIDRVEIIRGPGSSLYGNNAFFAVVNVITRRGRALKGAEVSGEAGRYDTYKGRATYGDRFRNGLEAIVSGTAYDSKGQSSLYFREFDPAFSSDPRATNNGVTNHADYDRFHSFFTKDSFQDFTLEAAYNSRTKGIPTGAFGTDFNDPGNKTLDTRGYADLRYEHSLGKQTDVTARVYYDYYEYYGDYLYSGVLNKDWAYGEWWGGDLKFTSPFYLFVNQRAIIGAEYTDNLRQDQKNYDVQPYNPVLDDKRSSRIWAGYVQDEITLARNMLLNLGIRYDHYSTFGGTTNPRLAFIYTPVEKSTLKLLYGSAFRAPNVFELYYASSTSLPNPDLLPEKIKTYELVYEQYLGDHLRATAAGYYYKINNLINQTNASPGVTIFRNLEQVEARGFEMELENKWTSGIEGRISYTLQKTIDKQTGETLTNSPEHLAKLNITVPLLRDKLFAGIEEQYTSKRKTVAGDYTRDFYITNLTLYSQRLRKGLDLSASIYNLFDTKYGDPVSTDLLPLDTVQQDGRLYRLKLTYAF